MTDHGMLFSATMIRALRSGLKTQTRRILSPKHINLWSDTAGRYMQPTKGILEAAMTEVMDFKLIDGIWTWTAEPLPHQESAVKTIWMGETPIQPGDRLWVKENWRAHEWYGDSVAIAYAAEKQTAGWSEQHELIPYPNGDKNAFKYYPPKGLDKWRPSIHMPRWASRITLCVTDVRIERLQDISEADAIAEGIEPLHKGWFPYGITTPFFTFTNEGREVPAQYVEKPTESYRMLWDHINGKGAWESNPWVIAYTFTVHRQNVDKMETATLGAAA